MTFGYTGSVLHVDLTTSSIRVENPAEDFYRMYGGGSAMGLFFLLKEIWPGVKPFSAENVLTLFTGPATGLPISGQSRISANALSPLTGAVGDSQGGGVFPAYLKFAGFDGIVIRGKSPKPVYLYIDDGVAEIRDAAHIWGKVTGEAEQSLKDENGGGRIEILQIGPAGEKLVRFASLINMCNRANGRTGMGAVMGSKLLKAVVVRGHQRPKAALPAVITRMQIEGTAAIPANPDMAALGRYGTASVLGPQHAAGTLPTRNYNEAQFEQYESLSGETMADTILTGQDTCYACAVRCKRVVETKFEGRDVLPLYGGPEYETLATFGSYCGVDDLAAVAMANQLCNMYGMDTISCGATIAWAMECFEKGILNNSQTDGLELKFGNASAMVRLVEKIGKREGFGDLLAEGSAHAAQEVGGRSEELLTTVKNQEAPAHMPQQKKTLGLIYAVNPFGADHQSSEHDASYEEGGADLTYERLALLGLTEAQSPMSMNEEKVRYAYLTQLFYSALDSYNLCQFVWGPAWSLYGPAEMAEMLTAATGWDVTVATILTVGERRLNMMRMFNARFGFTRVDDKLPEKFSKALAGTGPTAGVALDEAELEIHKDTYYHLAGWDPQTGIPTSEKLNELGLGWIDSTISGGNPTGK